MESINDLDEAMVLGYFESLKGNFLLKYVLMGAHLKHNSTKSYIDDSKIPGDVIDQAKKNLTYQYFLRH